MAFYDNALNLFSTDINTALLLLGVGFLVCHILHAIRYGLFGSGMSSFDKLKKFFQQLFFLKLGY